MQGPEPYLLDLAITLPCAVHPEKEAILDTAHRAFVNYEVYYVSDTEALDEFRKAPYRYAGRVTDPVTRARFGALDTSPRRDAGGRIFYFASVETAARFDEDPEAYAAPMITMAPADE